MLILTKKFRGYVLTDSAKMYSDAIQYSGAPIDSFVGFTDVKHIQNYRSGGHAALQRVVHSGYKRYHFLIYRTIAAPYGFISHKFGPEDGRR